MSPSWSPDGTQIAFYRCAGRDSGNLSCPRAWRAGTKVAIYKDLWGATISWSPDGKWIALADLLSDGDPMRIYLLSPQTLEIRQIPVNPLRLGEGNPAFSHDGKYLAYWCL